MRWLTYEEIIWVIDLDGTFIFFMYTDHYLHWVYLHLLIVNNITFIPH